MALAAVGIQRPTHSCVGIVDKIKIKHLMKTVAAYIGMI